MIMLATSIVENAKQWSGVCLSAQSSFSHLFPNIKMHVVHATHQEVAAQMQLAYVSAFLGEGDRLASYSNKDTS